MELDIGKHCEVVECKQIDFLPFVCSGCKKITCLEHRTYDSHKCPNANHKDKQIDTCPLCEQPISIKKGEDINLIVERHILAGCKSDTKERQKNSRCSSRGCKNHELIPFKCKQCNKNFCVSHRNQLDHRCTVKINEPMRNIGPFRIPLKVR